MTVLSACQSAAIRLVGRKPTTIFGSTSAFELELSDLVQEAAVDIGKAFEWQALTELAEHQGNGTLIAFPLPAGYDRMPIEGYVHSATWQQSGYAKARSLDYWLFIQTSTMAGTPGFWIILDGKMQIFPAIPANEKAQYYYLTNKIFSDKNGADKSVTTVDDDVFKLDERLLTLSLIWRWRQQKRFEYAEDLSNYERALSQTGGKDKAGRILKIGPGRLPYDADFAFPGVIVAP